MSGGWKKEAGRRVRVDARGGQEEEKEQKVIPANNNLDVLWSPAPLTVFLRALSAVQTVTF